MASLQSHGIYGASHVLVPKRHFGNPYNPARIASFSLSHNIAYPFDYETSTYHIPGNFRVGSKNLQIQYANMPIIEFITPLLLQDEATKTTFTTVALPHLNSLLRGEPGMIKNLYGVMIEENGVSGDLFKPALALGKYSISSNQPHLLSTVQPPPI
jgi:hypothetical protein